MILCGVDFPFLWAFRRVIFPPLQKSAHSHFSTHHQPRHENGIGAAFLGRPGRSGSRPGTLRCLRALVQNLSAIIGRIVSALPLHKAR